LGHRTSALAGGRRPACVRDGFYEEGGLDLPPEYMADRG
jgi:hypothetical protein